MTRTEQKARNRAYILQHPEEARRDPMGFAHKMKAQGFYSHSTAIADIRISIKKVLGETGTHD